MSVSGHCITCSHYVKRKYFDSKCGVSVNEKQNVGKDNESDDTEPKNDPNH